MKSINSGVEGVIIVREDEVEDIIHIQKGDAGYLVYNNEKYVVVMPDEAKHCGIEYAMYVERCSTPEQSYDLFYRLIGMIVSADEARQIFEYTCKIDTLSEEGGIVRKIMKYCLNEWLRFSGENKL